MASLYMINKEAEMRFFVYGIFSVFLLTSSKYEGSTKKSKTKRDELFYII